MPNTITDSQNSNIIYVVPTAQELAAQVIPVRTPAQLFNVNKFIEDLMVAFSSDANMLLYYAPIKDLASFGNFYGMNVMVNGLLAASKITSGEVTTLNAVLANQGIVLSTFTTPP